MVAGLNDQLRDEGRIEQGFRLLAAESRTWPAPRHLLDVLPTIEVERSYFQALPKPELTDEEKNAEHNRRCAIIARETDRLAQLMRGHP